MKTTLHISRWLIVLLAVSLLTACESTDENYGKYWDASHFETAIKVMPANAPSIRNRFYHAPETDIRDPFEHLGIDIIATEGTPVIAAARGTVSRRFSDPMYGNQIMLDHGKDASGRRVQTFYKHLHSQNVKIGDTVVRGQQIGTLGRTGVLAGGMLHLHYEVLVETPQGLMETVDPNRYWISGVGVITCFKGQRDRGNAPFRTTYPVACNRS